MNSVDWSVVKPTDIVKVHCRSEGEVNSYWRVFLKDGTEQGFTGYQSGPHFDEDNRGLDEFNPKLYEFLEKCSGVGIPYPYDSENDGVDYDVVIRNRDGVIKGLVTNIVIQQCDCSDELEEGEVYTKYPEDFNFEVVLCY